MKPNDPKKLTEEEIAEVANVFFTQKGWNLFPEVVIPVFGGRPDLMGVKESLCMAIEAKASLTYPVLEQLTRWHRTVNEAKDSSYLDETQYGIPHLLVAVSARGKNSIQGLKADIIAQYRIGYYEISYEGTSWRDQKDIPFDNHGYGDIDGHRWRVHEVVSPKIQPGSRRSADKIMRHLQEDMKIGVAGSTGAKGAYMTPFKRTLNKAVKVLENRGECHISVMVDLINSRMGGHHYANDASAKAGIAKFLLQFDLATKPEEHMPVYRLKGLTDDDIEKKKDAKQKRNEARRRERQQKRMLAQQTS